MSGLLALVSGRDPGVPADGHSHYVRAHGRAALEGGLRPELFFVDGRRSTRVGPYGLVRGVRSPGPARQHGIALHSPRLARAIAERARASGGPVVVHGFGVWSHAAVVARDRLRADGVEARAVASFYTTYVHEARSLLRGAAGTPISARARYAAEAAWARAVVERYERRACHEADAVWVNYERVAELLADRHGPGPRVERRLYGPESAFETTSEPRRPVELSGLDPARGPLVVCASRHHSRKGVDVLIEALAHLRDSGVAVRACLLGLGPLLDANRDRVRRLGLADRVLVPGPVESVEPLLAAADVYVLPSREEQSGALSVLEAMRAGTAIVASGVDGILEDLRHGRDALLVAPGDVHALAAAIARLAGDPPLRARLATSAAERFRERFSAEAFTRDLVAAYARLGLGDG